MRSLVTSADGDWPSKTYQYCRPTLSLQTRILHVIVDHAWRLPLLRQLPSMLTTSSTLPKLSPRSALFHPFFETFEQKQSRCIAKIISSRSPTDVNSVKLLVHIKGQQGKWEWSHWVFSCVTHPRFDFITISHYFPEKTSRTPFFHRFPQLVPFPIFTTSRSHA